MASLWLRIAASRDIGGTIFGEPRRAHPTELALRPSAHAWDLGHLNTDGPSL